MSRRSLFWVLSILLFLQWLFLAFDVHSRKTWLLENMLVLVFIGPSIWFYIKGYLSKTAYALIVLFLLVHNVGAHYSYSLVPYDAWFISTFGFSLDNALGFQRNHYDRLIHFLWGFVLYLPVREALYPFLKLKGVRLAVFTVFTLTVAGAVYELIEWGAAIFAGDQANIEYVGAQGDMWDAQKDQALAILGTLLAWPLWAPKELPKP